MDYDKKLDEYTVGFTLVVSYSVNETNKVHAFGFAKKEKKIFDHIQNWEKHFEKQKEQTKDSGVTYSCSLTILRTLYYSNIGSLSVIEMSKEELQSFFA